MKPVLRPEEQGRALGLLVVMLTRRRACLQLLAATAGKPLIMEEFGITHDDQGGTFPYPSRDVVFAR